MAKCKKCEKEALPGEEYCASCRESKDFEQKKWWEVVVCVVGGIVVAAATVFLGKKSGDGDAASA